MTKEEAQAIMDAHGILETMENAQEMMLLHENNPVLAHAYYKLNAIANGDEARAQHDVSKISEGFVCTVSNDAPGSHGAALYGLPNYMRGKRVTVTMDHES